MGDAGQSTLEERIRHYEQAVSDVDAISVGVLITGPDCES